MSALIVIVGFAATGCAGQHALTIEQHRHRSTDLGDDAKAVAEVYCEQRQALSTATTASIDEAFAADHPNEAVAAALVEYGDASVRMADEIAKIDVVTPDARAFAVALGDEMTRRRAQFSDLADSVRQSDPNSPRFAQSTEQQIEQLSRSQPVTLPAAVADFWANLDETMRASSSCRSFAGTI